MKLETNMIKKSGLYAVCEPMENCRNKVNCYRSGKEMLDIKSRGNGIRDRLPSPDRLLVSKAKASKETSNKPEERY